MDPSVEVYIDRYETPADWLTRSTALHIDRCIKIGKLDFFLSVTQSLPENSLGCTSLYPLCSCMKTLHFLPLTTQCKFTLSFSSLSLQFLLHLSPQDFSFKCSTCLLCLMRRFYRTNILRAIQTNAGVCLSCTPPPPSLYRLGKLWYIQVFIFKWL